MLVELRAIKVKFAQHLQWPLGFVIFLLQQEN